MPKFAANLTMLFNEAPFMERFALAAKAGFEGVEYLFPYDFDKDAIRAELDKHGLTQERAADAIGVSRRMLNYYLSGAKAIPKTVWLACLGWEAMKESAPA